MPQSIDSFATFYEDASRLFTYACGLDVTVFSIVIVRTLSYTAISFIIKKDFKKGAMAMPLSIFGFRALWSPWFLLIIILGMALYLLLTTKMRHRFQGYASRY